MNIILSRETQQLLEDRMKNGSFASADDALRTALEAAEQVEGRAELEQLDPETQQAIADAEAQLARGEGRPWEEVRAELMSRYVEK